MPVPPVCKVAPCVGRTVCQNHCRASTTCVVRPEQTEGAYYVDTGLDRSDIREEREGVPLDLTFNVSRVDEGDISACGPLAGAVVDIWHCDALGEYSAVEDNTEGLSTLDETFLRGYEVTDENGTARSTRRALTQRRASAT
jgi:protocatechuate 3,4-dioxygenase beta subunit